MGMAKYAITTLQSINSANKRTFIETGYMITRESA